MRREVSCLVAAVVLLACNSLSDKECTAIRSEAYDILNEAHTCGEDGDCLPSEWPGCSKPLSNKNNDRIAPLKDRFDKGSCVEQHDTCPDTPLVYCKQGLCVFRHEAGEKGKGDTAPAASK
jgi:hypothetical protein